MDLTQKRPSFSLVEVSGAERMQKFSVLLDNAFGVPAGTHYLEDFPIWAVDEPGLYDVMRIAAESDAGELACVAGVRLASLKVKERGLFPIALIGAVATAEPFRGQGLASQVVEQAVQWAQHRGAVAAFLWGSEHTLYGKLGFALCGTQQRLPLADAAIPAGETLTLQRGWHPALYSLLMKREEGIALRPSDRAWVEAHRHVEWVWIGTPNAPRAYAAIGRGIDLQNLIHEWGGERQALLSLLTALRAERPELGLLGPPAKIAELGLTGGPSTPPVEALFLAHVLNPSLVFPESSPPLWQGLDARETAQLCFGQPGVAPQGMEAWIWGLDAV